MDAVGLMNLLHEMGCVTLLQDHITHGALNIGIAILINKSRLQRVNNRPVG